MKVDGLSTISVVLWEMLVGTHSSRSGAPKHSHDGWLLRDAQLQPRLRKMLQREK